MLLRRCARAHRRILQLQVLVEAARQHKVAKDRAEGAFKHPSGVASQRVTTLAGNECAAYNVNVVSELPLRMTPYAGLKRHAANQPEWPLKVERADASPVATDQSLSLPESTVAPSALYAQHLMQSVWPFVVR